MRLDSCRLKYVEKVEKHIVFGVPRGSKSWKDVEADETCFRKALVENAGDAPDDAQLEWEQWGRRRPAR